MSEIRVDNIIGETGTDAVRFTKGINVTGIVTATNVSIGSSVTAANFFGSGASLTNLPGGGKLLKQDYTVLTSEFSTTNTSDYVDVTNMSFNFTPSAAGSKIWLIATPMVACADKQQTADGWVALRRGSTVLYETKEWSYTWTSQNYRTGVSRPFVMQYIDTPTYNLGDSISYSLSLKKVNSGIRCNWNSTGNSNFVIWEIAA